MVHDIVSSFWKGTSQNMQRISAPPEVGKPKGFWVQTERKAHEEWARFSLRKPTASALLHFLVAKMGPQNAVVISQGILAELLGVTDRTIRTALGDLAAERWIQVVRIGKGKEAAYVVNDQVAWGQARDQLRLSMFSATVVASAADQDNLDTQPLRTLPRLFPEERQLPAGDGLPPPSEPALPGMEPDLPALREPERGGEARSIGSLLPFASNTLLPVSVTGYEPPLEQGRTGDDA